MLSRQPSRTSNRHLAPRDPIDNALLGTLERCFGDIRGLVGVLGWGLDVDFSQTEPRFSVIVDDFDVVVAESVQAASQRASEALESPVLVDVLLHRDLDVASIRQALFQHAHGSTLFLLRAKHASLVVVGTNPFSVIPDPLPQAMRKEAVRSLMTIALDLRRLAIHHSDQPVDSALVATTTLDAVQNICAFHGHVSASHRDGVEIVLGLGLLDEESQGLINRCLEQPELSGHPIDVEAFIFESISFLEDQREILRDKLVRFGMGNVRWNGTTVGTSWDLAHLQVASMLAVTCGDHLVMLQRSEDDYLYPGMWTIVGGYIEVGETPIITAQRELTEELGVSATPEALFNFRPLESNRLAIFPFTVKVPEDQEFVLTEHPRYRLVELAALDSLATTPETSLVLEALMRAKGGATTHQQSVLPDQKHAGDPA